MIERLAYWITIIQIPIYIAQKDVPGGLHFAQTTKGLIFFWWALVQNLTPVFWGAVSDKIGQKRSLYISSIIIIIGYCFLATQREFFPFLLGTLVLGFGLGSYKPAIQGWIAKEI
ncbi:MAG TPA: MFS transporter, partial [Candidatus Kapabacteria bacterium]|nr:MFS transporter [Candidatus Kapabacteria bacterium]